MSQPNGKEFFDLIKSIGETRSKQEEDRIILREIASLKSHMNKPNVPSKLMRECIIRLLYCEMLGHEASFGYISAIKLTSSKNLLEKRVGYLAVSLCIPKDHELQLLIIANLQKDLQSTNFMEVSCALTAAIKLISEETIPALINHVLKLKNHPNSHIRKKVIVLLHAFHKISSASIPNILDCAKEALCDSDPCVMAASLGLFYDLAQDIQYLAQLKGLTSSFVAILSQIKDHRLSRDYDYHRLPAPWVQIMILKILALIGKDDKAESENMYDILQDIMTRADIGLNIGHAVIYECITTITSIYPNNMLLLDAASASSRFITNASHNLKYLGIKALTELVRINPKFAEEHQMEVINCLEDSDETLKRNTLTLLYTMTNASNATVIVKKLLEFAKKALDNHMREELVQKITSLAEKFTPNIYWYIDTMNVLFEIGPEYVPQNAIQNMMTVISLGMGDDEEKDEEMRKYCVDTFYEILENRNVVHDLHLQVISWILGEYGYMSDQRSQNNILELLCDVADTKLEQEETRSWIISALMKLVAQTGEVLPPSVESILHKYKNSRNIDLQQRCYEFLALCNACDDSNRGQAMEAVLPIDGSCEEIEVDESLSFLQDFVQQALDMGALPYLQRHQRITLEEQVEKKRQKLKVEEYAKPITNPVTHLHETFVSKGSNITTELTEASSETVVAHKEHSYYPSHIPSNTQMNLDPQLLQNKRKIWEWEDEKEDEVPALDKLSGPYGNNSPNSLARERSDTVSSNGSSADSPRNPFVSSLNSFPLSKQEKVEPKTKKQERLMKELFGAGIDASKYTPKKHSAEKKQPTRRRNSKIEQEPSSSKKANANLLEDMFGDASINIASQQQQPTPKAQNKDNPMIDLDDLFSSSSTTSTTSPSRPMNNSNTMIQNLDTLFGTDSGHTTNQSPSNPTNKPQQYESFNDHILKPTPVVAISKQFSSMGISSKQNYLISTLETEAKRASETVSLAKDDLLEITCDKFWRQDSIVIALQFRTDRGYTLTNLQCQLQAPSKFKMNFEFDSTLNSAPIVRGNHVTFSKLEPGTSLALLLELQLLDFIGFGNSVMGSISYADHAKQSKALQIKTQVDLIDLLRPMDMPVADFGKQWVSYPHEKKVIIKSAHSTPITAPFYSEQVEKQLNIHVIQTIKQECVALARVIGHEDNVLVLAHAKLPTSTTGLIFTVKSKDKTLCDHICRLGQKIFG